MASAVFYFVWVSYLEVLPAAAGGQVLYDEAVLCPHRGSIPVSANVTLAAVTATFRVETCTWKAEGREERPRPQLERKRHS